MCFVIFFNYMEGPVDPHSKTGSLLALGTPSTPRPSLCPRGSFKAPKSIQAKARRALSRSRPGLRRAQQRAPRLPTGQGTPLLSPRPHQVTAPLRGAARHPCSAAEEWGWQMALPPAGPTMLCPDLRLSDFLRTKKKKKPTKKQKIHPHTKNYKKKNLKTFRELLFTLLTYGFII